MRTIRIISVIAVALLFFSGTKVHAAKIVLKSGDLSALKSEKVINLRFDYSNMTVGKKLTEEEYVSKKVSDHNAKEPGKGDRWKEAWINARKERYQPKFIELFNKYSADDSRRVSENAPKSKYTLIVKTRYTEPGFNVGVWRESARVDFDFLVVETANPSNVVAELSADKVPGAEAMGNDYDAGSRIEESYAKGAKMLAKYFSDKIK